jgi:gamma-glutamyltranspeptidase / glutathione hydrolase
MSHPRRALYAPHGVVATSQPLAASAGLAVLRRGGNAVDAALATAITLTVVEPGSNDVGGDLFAIVWDGTELVGLNASGRSPAALSLAAAGGRMPADGWLPVTVPGAPAGWRDLHARYGRLPFADLFTDAIGYAADGYPVSPTVARSWAHAVARHARLHGPEYGEWARLFGHAPRPGETFRNPDKARTLDLIARSGADEFYHGDIAHALAAHARATGGLLTEADLAGHRSTWVDPLSVRYHGYEVWELPPNGQGLAALLALAILDDLPEPGLHARIEAMKLGYADAHAYVADPDVAPAPLDALLDKEYAARRRALIGETAGVPVAGDPVKGGTVYLCTADADGMMVSLIQSSYDGFGSHVALPGYGFGLQNRGAGFATDPGHPNVVAGRKRPYHTIIPGFLTRDGQPVGPFGVMGGHMQPQGHVQVVLSTVDDGLDPQAALDAPRWYWESGRHLYVEPELDTAAADDLRRRGHEVTVESSSRYGRGQAIWRNAEGYVAGSEPRADGCAVGY